MKKSIISETQIVKAIKEYEGGREPSQICRELGIHKSTFYNWRKKYAGMDSQELKRFGIAIVYWRDFSGRHFIV